MHPPISEKVYQGLKASILSLALKPGADIDINLITENLGVSRSPVRDALLELEKEGLVTIQRQSSTRVSRINLGLVNEERFLRASLEEKTLELFVGAHSKTDFAHLEEALARQKKSLKEADYLSFLLHDDEFHRIFFTGAGKDMCWKLIQNASGHYRRIRLLTLEQGGTGSSILAEHGEILAAIGDRNTKSAVRAVRSHLSKIMIEEKALLEKHPDYFIPKECGDPYAAPSGGNI